MNMVSVRLARNGFNYPAEGVPSVAVNGVEAPAGSLPGTTTILVLVDGGACFAGLVNTRVGDGQEIGRVLDTLMWNIYDQAIG
jgi:hypothetical protein